MKEETLNKISFKDKKVFLDEKEVKGITDLEIKKNASEVADVVIKLNAYIKDLDDE